MSETPSEQQSAALAMAPGSASAVAAGCKCPILDNARGKGWLCSGHFIVREDCPIHGTAKQFGQHPRTRLRPECVESSENRPASKDDKQGWVASGEVLTIHPPNTTLSHA